MSDPRTSASNNDGSRRAATAEENLTTFEVVLLGAAGGLIAALVSHTGLLELLSGANLSDWKNFDWLEFGGTGVICVFLGSIWGYVHIPERDRRKALQIGLVAPAVISSTIYANIPDQDDELQGTEQAGIHRQHAPSAYFGSLDPNVINFGMLAAHGLSLSEQSASADRRIELAQQEKKKKKKKRKKRKPWWKRVF